MTNEIKEILKTAINNNENCIYFAPNSRGTYTVTVTKNKEISEISFLDQF